MAVFDDTTMEWAVVSRVRMDKEGTKAYALAFKKTFQNCEEDHPEFSPADSLLGVVTDWSDAEISSWERLLVKKPLQNSYEDVRFIGQDRGNVSETILHTHLINPVKRHCLVNIFLKLVDQMATMSSMVLKFSVVMLLLCHWEEL